MGRRRCRGVSPAARGCSLSRTGISDGATTSHATPSFVKNRHTANPPGPQTDRPARPPRLSMNRRIARSGRLNATDLRLAATRRQHRGHKRGLVPLERRRPPHLGGMQAWDNVRHGSSGQSTPRALSNPGRKAFGTLSLTQEHSLSCSHSCLDEMPFNLPALRVPQAFYRVSY